MPNTVTQTILQEGTRIAIVHWYFESDGNEGEFTDRVILDPALDFKVPIPNQLDEDGKLRPPAVTIREVWFSPAWFDMTIGFEGTVPNYVLPLARDCEFHMDLRQFGGFKDRTNYEGGGTGRIIMKTKDFAPLGSNGFLVLSLRKE